jgi:hypothetical protein
VLYPEGRTSTGLQEPLIGTINHMVPKRNASARRLPRQTTLQEYFLNIDRLFFRNQISDGWLLTVIKPWRWEV